MKNSALTKKGAILADSDEDEDEDEDDEEDEDSEEEVKPKAVAKPAVQAQGKPVQVNAKP